MRITLDIDWLKVTISVLDPWSFDADPNLDPRHHATGLQICLQIRIRIMLFYSVAKYYLHALFQQVPVNSLLWIEQICYFFQYRYWGTNLFLLVFRRSSQGTCCTFPLPLLWTSWTDHIRERLLLLYCTPRLEVRGFFEIVWVYVQGYGSGSTWICSNFLVAGSGSGSLSMPTVAQIVKITAHFLKVCQNHNLYWYLYLRITL